MHIDSCIRELLQNAVPKLHFDFRRGHRIGFFRAPGLDLKAYGLVPVSGAEVGEHGFFQNGKVCGIGNLHHRCNTRDAEYMLKRIHAFFVVIAFGLDMHIDSAALSGYIVVSRSTL